MPPEAIAKAAALHVGDRSERDAQIACSVIHVQDRTARRICRPIRQARAYQITFSMITAGMPEPLTPQSGVVPTCLKPSRS